MEGWKYLQELFLVHPYLLSVPCERSLLQGFWWKNLHPLPDMPYLQMFLLYKWQLGLTFSESLSFPPSGRFVGFSLVDFSLL